LVSSRTASISLALLTISFMIEALQLASYKFFTVFFRVILDYKSNIFRYRTINQWAGEENSSKDICPKADLRKTFNSLKNTSILIFMHRKIVFALAAVFLIVALV